MDRRLRALITLVFLYLAGFGMVLPTLPLFVRSLGADYAATGIFISAYGLARLGGDLIAARVVDRRGERWAAVSGSALLAVCIVATALSPTYGIAIGVWALGGVGSAVTFGALFSYVLKAAPKERMARTLSYFFGAFNVGVVAGGFAGGLIADRLGLRAPLYFYAAAIVMFMFLYRVLVPDLPPSVPGVEGGEELDASTVRRFLRIPGFGTALYLNFAYLWMVGALFNTLISLYGKDELGLGPAGIGAVIGIAIATEFIAIFPAGRWSDRLGRRAVLIPSMLALALMTGTLGTATSVAGFAVLIGVLGLASGFAGVPPAAVLSDVVPVKHAGRAVGAFRFCGDLGFFFGPLAAGLIAQALGFAWAFVVVAVPIAGAAFASWRMTETLKRG